ncbi:hypothetical protein CYK37_00265 [Mesorhizobium loti]|nr:hypothetical protein CYK37_00265 [Mesorhizobium loti]
MILARAGNLRGFFSDAEKHAIALESDQNAVSVSQVTRKHMLFRWRVQFGAAQKKRAKLATAALTDDRPVARPRAGFGGAVSVSMGASTRRRRARCSAAARLELVERFATAGPAGFSLS